MMKVGIKLDDGDFARAFAKGLMHQSRNMCFLLLKKDDDTEHCDLVLASQSDDRRHTVALVKHPDEERLNDGPPYALFQYKEAPRLIRDLLFIFFQETGRNLEFTGDTTCKTICFTSMSGGAEGTALALLTSHVLQKQYGNRCLYLNLCPIDGSRRFLPSCEEKRLLTMLYYLDEDRNFPLASFIASSSYGDYVENQISNPLFDAWTTEQLQRFLRKIDEVGNYAYLILDMGNHLCRSNKQLLTHSDFLFFLQTNGEPCPASFSQGVLEILKDASEDERVYTIVMEEDGERFPLEAHDALTEEGLVPLSAFPHLQWEAGRIAKYIMEGGLHD